MTKSNHILLNETTYKKLPAFIRDLMPDNIYQPQILLDYMAGQTFDINDKLTDYLFTQTYYIDGKPYPSVHLIHTDNYFKNTKRFDICDCGLYAPSPNTQPETGYISYNIQFNDATAPLTIENICAITMQYNFI